jgi:hypothetical protein
MFKSEQAEEIGTPEEKPVPASDRKAFEKAVEALKAALAAARSELSAGKLPAVGPVDKARKALLKVLGGSALGTTLGALQRLLRTGLLELVAAFAAAAPSDLPSLSARLDRCLSDLKDAAAPAAPESKFWEKTV